LNFKIKIYTYIYICRIKKNQLYIIKQNKPTKNSIMLNKYTNKTKTKQNQNRKKKKKKKKKKK